MHQRNLRTPFTVATITLAMAASSGAHAYDEKSAISDCESRLHSEYSLSDFRHQKAQKLPGEGHKYKVTGETKIEGKKYPFGCQIEDRHVTSIDYGGPEPEGMGGAEKLAVGAAAAIAAGLVANELMNKEDDKPAEASSTQVASARTANPSFDCTKASHEVEELICKDPELADLDRSLTDLYGVVLEHSSASEQKQLKTEQRGWVKGRNDCWKSDDQRGCVKREYEARIGELEDR